MKEDNKSIDRRGFLLRGALAGAATAIGFSAEAKHKAPEGSADLTGEATIRRLDVLKRIGVQEIEDTHLRMQRELVKSMAKPVEQRQWIMVIDTRKCIGCHACTVGCVAENKLPPGVVYRPVDVSESGKYPNVHIRHSPRSCMQCEKPSCVPVCPVNATWKRPDGIVVVDYDKCNGCRSCLKACPYEARTADFGNYYSTGEASGNPPGKDRPLNGAPAPWESEPNNEYAKNWLRKGNEPPIGSARKCHFCLHRLEVGQLPTCVATCIGRATYFGDANDHQSLVVEVTTKNNVQTLLSHSGNKPQCFYIF